MILELFFASFAVCGLAILITAIYAFAKNPDYFIHHKEYKNKGMAGEQNLYLYLRRFGVPKNQIFRNVYIAKNSGDGTAEIDMIVLSRKAIFVIETKNYSGKIYGDTKYEKWIQYAPSGKKSYFYSPILQNKNHVKVVREFLMKRENLRIIPVEIATTNAKWEVKNLAENDNFIANGEFAKRFREIYDGLDDMKIGRNELVEIREKFAENSRPNEKIRDEHIEKIKEKYGK